jgi:cysteine desulfurase
VEKIYLDNAATTSVRKEVYDAMLPYFMDSYGNPSSVYSMAQTTKNAISDARKSVARAIDAKEEEIFFTGSGTEADNWAIFGVASKVGAGGHIITSCFEHHAVLHSCQFLEKKGYDVTYLPVDETGIISLEELKSAIRPDTFLISIMYANNEIGTIQPIKEIGLIANERNILFHTDAVQAVGHVPISVKDLRVDMLSLSAHKINGPKGVGALYIKKGVKIDSFMHGGAQERKMRAGTENVPGIVGLGVAIQLKMDEMEVESQRITTMRDRLISGILNEIPHTKLNGHPEHRLPGNANISINFIEGESLILLLNKVAGICVSTGSACTSGSLDPSHVLLSLGLSHMEAHGSMRATIGKYNTDADIDTLIRELPPIVKRLRDMSPLNESSL